MKKEYFNVKIFAATRNMQLPPPWVPMNLSDLAHKSANCDLDNLSKFCDITNVVIAPATTNALELDNPEAGGIVPLIMICIPDGQENSAFKSSTTPLIPQRKSI